MEGRGLVESAWPYLAKPQGYGNAPVPEGHIGVSDAFAPAVDNDDPSETENIIAVNKSTQTDDNFKTQWQCQPIDREGHQAAQV